MPRSMSGASQPGGIRDLAFLKCSRASSCIPSRRALSPASYSVFASPRSFPSACAFLIFGKSSFLISVAVWAQPAVATLRASATSAARRGCRMRHLQREQASDSLGSLTGWNRAGQSRSDPRIVAPSALRQLPVLTLKEDERPSAADLRMLDGTDVDHVVAPLVGLDDAALHVAERAIEDRGAEPTQVIGHARELLATGLGEAGREGLLIRAQDVHDEALRVEE